MTIYDSYHFMKFYQPLPTLDIVFQNSFIPFNNYFLFLKKLKPILNYTLFWLVLVEKTQGLCDGNAASYFFKYQNNYDEKYMYIGTIICIGFVLG